MMMPPSAASLCAGLSAEIATVARWIQLQQRPGSEQLCSFLSSIVTKMAPLMVGCPREIASLCQGGFASIGWDVLTNGPIARSLPPHAEDVLQMLSTMVQRLQAGPKAIANATAPITQQQQPHWATQAVPVPPAAAPALTLVHCGQCQVCLSSDIEAHAKGKRDPTDGQWYCNACWAQWKRQVPPVSQVANEQPASEAPKLMDLESERLRQVLPMPSLAHLVFHTIRF
jgi:hypothetical protein